MVSSVVRHPVHPSSRGYVQEIGGHNRPVVVGLTAIKKGTPRTRFTGATSDVLLEDEHHHVRE